MEIENHPKVGLYTGGNLLEIHKKDLHIVLKHAAGLLVVGEELHLKKDIRTEITSGSVFSPHRATFVFPFSEGNLFFQGTLPLQLVWTQ